MTWPKPNGKPKTAINKLNTSTFAQMVSMIKLSNELDMDFAMRKSAGTTLLWRDILMMLMAGTLFQFHMPDGNILYGGGQLSQTIQGLLDSVSNVPGTILGRTAAGWQALTPAPANWILTSNGENTAPTYQPLGNAFTGYYGENHEVSAERDISLAYTNTTEKVMYVNACLIRNAPGGTINLLVNGLIVAWYSEVNAGYGFSLSGWVNPNDTYQFTCADGIETVTAEIWIERY